MSPFSTESSLHDFAPSIAAGARAKRLLWASTGTKDPSAPDTPYVEQRAACGTINTMPQETLHAFADHGHVKQALMMEDKAAEAMLAAYRLGGIDADALAARLQREGADAFSASWHKLLESIATKAAKLAENGKA